jgi:SAM-dependent methyltransferase
MPDPSYGPLRIWEGSVEGPAGAAESVSLDGPSGDDSSLAALAEILVQQEVLRAPVRRRESAEPLSLQWYLEVEELRHHRQGRWLPSLLEFGKHSGERLLGLGHALGSDLIQYARQGAEVVCACATAEQLCLVRRNFELRGLRGAFLHARPESLPLESSSIDVACLNGIALESAEPATLLDEVYRVLKPGGKVLALVPARYDVDFWSRWCLLGQRPPERSGDRSADACLSGGLMSSLARHFHRREMKQLFHRFHEPRVYKRHLRRAEVPHLWRWVPLGLLERMMGRLLVYKGFKPVSAAIGEQAAA